MRWKTRGLAAALGLAAAMAAAPAAAATRCEPIGAGVERCVSGLRPDAIRAIAQAQKASQWCWAAVVSMLLRAYGVAVAQEQVVRQYWGAAVDMALPVSAIPGLINRTWNDPAGRAVTLTARTVSQPAQGGLTSPDVLQDLDGERPLVLVVPGHAVVLVQLEYERPTGDDSGAQVKRAVVLDPAAQEGSVRALRPGAAIVQLTRVAAAGDGAVALAGRAVLR
ncbi:papain-like cysteine protease family protein [Ramlibacter humi]|uniref:Peptidase C39-like domain-containing protein n=1 Tax=Ramlibacter humi TaxID=2530451 RepID=A0A4Z0C8D5_9BURK|nr:papain-like cysteine protease family protein [Ramlibacter humi]TFZ07946.1 hypothetical protein EZ216_01915 [Ramlibacter humi]